MLALKKFVEHNPGHVRQNVYAHSLKTLKAMRSMTKDKFLLLLALAHDVGKQNTMVKKGSQIVYPNHDKAGAAMVGKMNLGLNAKQRSLAVKMLRNHLIAFTSKNFVREIRVKSKGFAKEQLLLAIADLKGGDGWKVSREDYFRKLKLFKQALRELS